MNGEVIRRRREELGLSQKALGAAIGVADSTICRLEKGKTYSVGIDMAFKIAGILGLEVNDLIRSVEK